jgi:hypothetical protein
MRTGTSSPAGRCSTTSRQAGRASGVSISGSIDSSAQARAEHRPRPADGRVRADAGDALGGLIERRHALLRFVEGDESGRRPSGRRGR